MKRNARLVVAGREQETRMTRQSSFESALAWMWRKLGSGHCQSASDFLIQLPRSVNICKQFRAQGFEYKSLSISNTSHPLICKAPFSKFSPSGPRNLTCLFVRWCRCSSGEHPWQVKLSWIFPHLKIGKSLRRKVSVWILIR